MPIITHPLSWSPDAGATESGDYVLTQGAFIVQFVNPLSKNNPKDRGAGGTELSDIGDKDPHGFTLFGVQEVSGMKRAAPQFDVVKDNGANFEYHLPQPVRKPITLNMSFVATARLIDLDSVDSNSGKWVITTDLGAMEVWHQYSVGVHSNKESGATISDTLQRQHKINFGYGQRASYEDAAYCRIIKLMELEDRDSRLDGYGGFDPSNSLRWTFWGARILAINYGKLSVVSQQDADANLLMSISVQGMLDWRHKKD